MKIVIDISEEGYNSITRGKWEGNPLADYIEDGTPLPKGHGRLIDADKYRRMWMDSFDSNYGSDCAKLFKDSVDYADTIIEADKETGGEQ